MRIAIIGLGVMGKNHLRVLSQINGVQVTALVDVYLDSIEKIAKEAGCLAFTSLEPLVGLVDAAIVAVPSIQHHDVGHFLLSNGIHCLIEKPLAVTEDECLSLIHAAEKANVTLMVGHIERFNPALQQLKVYLDNKINIHALAARRMNPAGKRIVDVDVVMDLMLHDIDAICYLKNVPLSSIKANSCGKDYVNALLRFEDGCIASLTASRITQNKVRDLLVTADNLSISLEYISQKLVMHSPGTEPVDHSPAYSESLKFELMHFIESVSSKKKPLIDGWAALNTLKIVWEIQNGAYC